MNRWGEYKLIIKKSKIANFILIRWEYSTGQSKRTYINSIMLQKFGSLMTRQKVVNEDRPLPNK